MRLNHPALQCLARHLSKAIIVSKSVLLATFPGAGAGGSRHYLGASPSCFELLMFLGFRVFNCEIPDTERKLVMSLPLSVMSFFKVP